MNKTTPAFDPQARERMASMLDAVNESITALGGISQVAECNMQSLEGSEADSLAAILLGLAGLMASTRELADAIRERTAEITQSN